MEANYTFSSWKAPEKTEKSFITGLKINNSLYPYSHTERLTEFIPARGKKVSWYMNGPTVSGEAHLGHAYKYLTFDMIRRVMEDYFGYDVFLVMHVSDIDEMITRQSHESNEEFSSISRKWEKEFFDDMKFLRVKEPNIITRVSEYVPQIVEYIQTIMKNGYAYETNGNVYFDVEAYQKKHTYGKLEPWSVNMDNYWTNEEYSGEAQIRASNEKRNRRDFALWRASKLDEPKWPSPWGEGRPGIRIGDSAIANEILGQTFDLFTGEIFLRFPDHEREIAQAEAHNERQQWVNYFIHSGRLIYKTPKMSMRLFSDSVSIKSLMANYDYKEIRLLFLLHKYEEAIDFDIDLGIIGSMAEPVERVRRFKDFFKTVKAVLRQNYLEKEQRWSTSDTELNQKFIDHQEKIHQHFKKNFFTPGVIRELDTLMGAVKVYLQSPGVKFPLITSITNYIKKIFKVMGLDFDETAEISTLKSEEEIITPFVDIIAKFRDQVRDAARKEEFGTILKAFDEIRDVWLPPLGVRLEDRINAPSIWKYEDKKVLFKEIQAKQEVLALKEEGKKQKFEQKKRKEEENREKLKVQPSQMFLQETDKYSGFDATGIPTHDQEGRELSKSLRKKLAKEYAKLERLHNEYHAQQN